MDIKNVLSKTDFLKICRICLKQSDNLISITLYQIIEMISTCTSVQVNHIEACPTKIKV